MRWTKKKGISPIIRSASWGTDAVWCANNWTYPLFLVAASLVAVGCNSGGPFDYVPVEGKVEYEDGSPVPGGQLQFTSEAPAQGTAHPRPAVASIGKDGTFQDATSHKYGDGLVPGKHKVSFIFATDSQGRPLVPPDYESAAKTPLEIDTANSPLTITVPKPKWAK